MALKLLSVRQVTLLSTGCGEIILKVKHVTCLEALYLRIDVVAVLATGKSQVFFLLEQLTVRPNLKLE